MQFYKKIIFRSIFLVLPMAFLISGCVSKRSRADNIVVCQMPSDPPGLHITNGNSIQRYTVFQYTQCALTHTDVRSLNKAPWMAKALPVMSADGLRATYELSDRPKWDDGTPLTVEDVAFSLKMVKCPLTGDDDLRFECDRVRAIEKDASNPLKFTIVFNKAIYNNAFLMEDIYLMEKHFWDSAGVMDNFNVEQFNDPNFKADQYPALQKFIEAFNSGENSIKPERLAGLGPYKVTQWAKGISITLEKKKHWWGDGDTSLYCHNNPDKIIFKIIRDPDAVELALKNKTLDVSTYILAASYDRLRNDKRMDSLYNFNAVNKFAYYYIGLNMKGGELGRKPFFADKKVRRALAYLTPVDDIIKVIAKGYGTRQVSYVSPLKYDYNTNMQAIPVDVEKAKKLLDESGWLDKDGDGIRSKIIDGKKVKFSFELNYEANPQWKQALLLIKDKMREAGIDMQPNPMDFSAVVKANGEHNFDAMLGQWGGDPSPDDPEQFWKTTNWVNKGGGNYVGFGNARTDSLIDVIDGTIDMTKRAMYSKQFQQIVYDEQPYIFLYNVKVKIAISKRFDNANTYNTIPFVMLNDLKLK